SPSQPVPQLLETERSLALPSLTHAIAFQLGIVIRSLALSQHPNSTIFISITSVVTPPGTPALILFQTCTGPDYLPDHMHWLERKRNTVLRFGCSSLVMREEMRRAGGGFPLGDLQAQAMFVEKFGVDGKKFVASGGGVPIRVKGVDGIVAVVCVSGVTQEQDHGLAMQGLRLLKDELEKTA
ncbi:hypothetical protein BGX38DRAFT_1107030, partial [Terfezia claveryi]